MIFGGIQNCLHLIVASADKLRSTMAKAQAREREGDDPGYSTCELARLLLAVDKIRRKLASLEKQVE
jgi:hypothetical protein